MAIPSPIIMGWRVMEGEVGSKLLSACNLAIKKDSPSFMLPFIGSRQEILRQHSVSEKF
jgi:hypothetical protein